MLIILFLVKIIKILMHVKSNYELLANNENKILFEKTINHLKRSSNSPFRGEILHFWSFSSLPFPNCHRPWPWSRRNNGQLAAIITPNWDNTGEPNNLCFVRESSPGPTVWEPRALTTPSYGQHISESRKGKFFRLNDNYTMRTSAIA